MKRITYIILFISCFQLSCEKEEEFKIPVDVTFTLDMQREKTSDSRIRFTEGHLVLASFEFEGDREQAEDVYFEKEYEQGLHVPFSPNQEISELKFQIPQGNYSRIAVAIETSDGEEENEDDEDETKSSLVVEGVYQTSEGKLLPLCFQLQSSEEIEVEAESLSDGSQIILKREAPATASIRLNPYYWFQAVPSSLLDNAEVVERNGVATILISEELNEQIYEIVVSRIGKGAEAVFTY